MEVERREKEIVVNLTREDVYSLQAGETIHGMNIHGGRPAVTMSDAKVEVMPLSHIEPDENSIRDRWAIDRLEKATEAPLKGYLWPDGDLQIFVPAIKLTDVRLTHANLPKEAIETPITNDRNGLLGVIPKKGIRLNFGGSLKTVHIPDFFS